MHIYVHAKEGCTFFPPNMVVCGIKWMKWRGYQANPHMVPMSAPPYRYLIKVGKFGRNSTISNQIVVVQIDVYWLCRPSKYSNIKNIQHHSHLKRLVSGLRFV